jgi:hypothetical protein
LNSFEGVRIENIVAIVEWRFLVIERREPHSLEMSTVPLLSVHGKPHAAPRSMVYRFDDARNLVYEGDGSGNVIEHGNFADLLPREWDVLE